MPEELTAKNAAWFWSKAANQWREQLRAGADINREVFNLPAFLEFAGELSGLEVLDAGCGEGQLTRTLAKRGARVTGIDLSPRMIELARQEEQGSPLGIRYELGSYTDLSFLGRGSFDRVICFMALMDGPEMDAAFGQFFNVLRPGGELTLSVLHPCFYTQVMRWRRANGQTYLRVGQYFDRATWLDKVAFAGARPADEPLVLPRFSRTLSDYLNALCQSNFVLTACQEPRPDEEACKKYPQLRPWRRHAALFLHLRARKPANGS